MNKNKNRQKTSGNILSSKGLAYFLIAFLILVIYGRTVNYDFAVDDKIVISENKNVQSGFQSIPSIFKNTTFHGFVKGDADKTYRPVTLSSYAIEIGIFGLNPGIHHAFNVIYYLLLCILIYYLLSRYMFPAWNKYFPILIALLFALHPIHTEVVSNIKSRDEILCFMFFLTSLLLLFKYLSQKKFYFYLLSLLSYCFSLFSKETSVTFILLFPLFLFMFSNKKIKEIIIYCLPYLIPLIIFLLARYFVVKDIHQKLTYINNGILAFHGYLERYGLVFYILLLYIKLLIIPYPLIWDYSYGHFNPNNTILIMGAISFFIQLYLLVYGILKIRQKKILAFAVLFYFVTISLVSNVFIYIASTMGERFLFIPSFAFCIAFVYLLSRIFKINLQKLKNPLKPAFLGLFIGLLVIYSLLSIARTNDWKNDYSLTLSNYGQTHSYRARLSYIEVLYKKSAQTTNNRDLFASILKELNGLIKDYPKDPEVWYLNGLVNNSLNNKKIAIASYKKVLLFNPRYLNALNNLGSIYQTSGIKFLNEHQQEKGMEALHKAIEYYNRALQIQPDYYLAVENLAKIYHLEGQYNKALIYYKKALKLQPNNQNLRNNYNLLLNNLKQSK